MKKPYSIRKSGALHQHWTWKSGVMKAKMQFKTIDEAIEFIHKHRLSNKYHPYICTECGMWHIGHNKLKNR